MQKDIYFHSQALQREFKSIISSTSLPSNYWTAKKWSAIYHANVLKNTMIFSRSWWVDAAIVDTVNNFTTEWRFPAAWYDVHLLKKGNVKPVKSSFNEKGFINHYVLSSHENGSFRSHQTRRSNDQCVRRWYSQFMKFLLFCYTGLYTECKIFAEKC